MPVNKATKLAAITRPDRPPAAQPLGNWMLGNATTFNPDGDLVNRRLPRGGSGGPALPPGYVDTPSKVEPLPKKR
jgi:hypothetical protein